MKVILIRHAQTEWNMRGIVQGQGDSELTHRGELQTSALLAAFSASDYRVDSVYTSPLGRTHRMGTILAKHFCCSLVTDPALKEQALGEFEGMSVAWLMQHHPDTANRLFNSDAEYCPANGESLVQACHRFIHFLYNLEQVAPHKTICIVSHGQVIQGVIALLKEVTINHFSKYAHSNASYSIFDLNHKECKALKWGIATHLRHIP